MNYGDAAGQTGSQERTREQNNQNTFHGIIDKSLSRFFGDQHP